MRQFKYFELLRRRLGWHLALSVLLSALLLLLGACQKITPAASEAIDSPAPEIPATPTVAPTPSPSPIPEQVILVMPPEAQSIYEEQLWPVLKELSASAGFILEKRQSLAEIDFNQAVRLVVAVPSDLGLAEAATRHPEVQFLAVEIPGLEATANLSLISPSGPRLDQQGFAAGYLAAVITSDWRVGVISLGGEAGGQAALNGFVKGAIFFCGLCRPYFPPFVQYPFAISLVQNSDPTEQALAAQQLTGNAVKTVYIYPGVKDAGLWDALSQAGVQIIGGGEPPPGLETGWVAGIQSDLAQALRQLWPDLLAGRGGQTLDAPLRLVAVNAERLSPGRQRLVEKLMAELTAGYVDTGVDPLTGATK